MKKNNLTYMSLMIVSIIILSVSFIDVRGTKADESVYNVDISTSPAQGFLIADNMAPGDNKTSILKVSNNGNLDFNYSVSSSQVDGDVDLYKKILLKVSDNKGSIYEGTLNNFLDFPLGTIAIGESSTLTFTAELPLDIGNAFQGESTTVAFDFTAIAHDEEIPTDSCFEPPFSNKNFTLQQNSTVPIKFNLRDSSGNIDLTQHQNVKLVISGPGIKTSSGSYIFAVTDGTLSFPKNIDEPHYQARFSTFDYPVVSGNTYSANVYFGDNLVCKKDFMVLDNGNRSNAP